MLVVRRAIPPQLGKLAIVGGFVEDHESWQHGGAREVREETGAIIDAGSLEPMWYASSAPRPNRVLLFSVAPPIPAAALPPFTHDLEASERGLIFGPEGLDEVFAFPLHVTPPAGTSPSEASPAPTRSLRADIVWSDVRGLGEISPRHAARRRRNGRGVHRFDDGCRGLLAQDRDQARAPRLLGEPGVRTDVHRRGEDQLAPRPSQHRLGARLRSRRREPPVPGDGAGRRARSRRAHLERAAPDPRRDLRDQRDAARPGIRARPAGRHEHARRRAPRRVAPQRAVVVGGRGQGLRLRHREGARCERGDGVRVHQGQARVHEPRAGEWSAARWA